MLFSNSYLLILITTQLVEHHIIFLFPYKLCLIIYFKYNFKVILKTSSITKLYLNGVDPHRLDDDGERVIELKKINFMVVQFYTLALATIVGVRVNGPCQV